MVVVVVVVGVVVGVVVVTAARRRFFGASVSKEKTNYFGVIYTKSLTFKNYVYVCAPTGFGDKVPAVVPPFERVRCLARMRILKTH